MNDRIRIGSRVVVKDRVVNAQDAYVTSQDVPREMVVCHRHLPTEHRVCEVSDVKRVESVIVLAHTTEAQQAMAYGSVVSISKGSAIVQRGVNTCICMHF